MTVLILGGTAEAHEISTVLGAGAVVSLAHAIEQRAYTSPVRRGGFGGEDAQTTWMHRNRISAVVDASHPFAVRISSRTASIAERLSLPYLRLVRPPWRMPKDGDWTSVARPEDVVALVPEAARTLLAVGGEHLGDFVGLRGAVYLRAIAEPAEVPFALTGFVRAGTADAASERALFEKLALTHLVTRNSGGGLSGKLMAARELGVTVVMIERPPLPARMNAVETPEAALDWLSSLP